MEAMSTIHTDRVTGVVNDALAAIHEVLERHRVTEQEWHGGARASSPRSAAPTSSSCSPTSRGRRC